jgi:tRNA threonylcarbamoyladenosine biosynthesis protein TsaE
MQIALSGISTCASDLLLRARPIAPNGPTCIGLSGELGAGKTALTQALAKILRVKEHVTSPTFVIAKSYPASHPRFKTLIHIDAYRIESKKELEHIGWEEMLTKPETLIVVEWPERIEDALPTGMLRATLTITGEDVRECTYAEA